MEAAKIAALLYQNNGYYEHHITYLSKFFIVLTHQNIRMHSYAIPQNDIRIRIQF